MTNSRAVPQGEDIESRMPIKIVIVVENFFPHIGGVEKFLLDLAKGLLKRGAEVRVVTSDSGGITGFHQFEGVDVYSYHWFSFSGHAIPTIKSLEKHICWADVVHTNTYTTAPVANFVGKKHHKPVLITVHEILGEKWGWIEPNLILQLGYRLFERYVATRNYDCFVCNSNATKRDLQKLKISPDKVCMVYMAAGTDDFDMVKENRQALCELVGIDEKSKIFLYFGRPGQSKGIFVYLDAIKLAAPKLVKEKVRFVFILAKEPHQERERFVRQVHADGLDSLIVICDSQPRAKLLEYIKSSDFVVIPSITEGFGFTTVESCQLGKRVIHSSGGSLPEVAFGSTLQFENRNSQDLAEKLKYALNGGEFEQTPLHVFDEESMVSAYLEIYKELGAGI